ncbi:MAG: RNase J family beta-CASP ribonuclease [Clostridia bacterium]|nr:RNase J family beta-CASP ribonuclease [Clostridia bacterium]
MPKKKNNQTPGAPENTAPETKKKQTKKPAAKKDTKPAEKPQSERKTHVRKPKNQKNSAPRKNEKSVKVIPLGGLGEIGKNMTLLEFEDDIIIIDCGIGFPEEDMPGVDLVIPNFAYLEEHRTKIRGVLLTHGHEDHIGGIPYLLRHFNIPIWGTALTIGIIKGKLKEHRMPFTPQLNVVSAGDTVKLGVFTAEFIHVNHSIADACALAINTPCGYIIHTGDFKIDVSPIEGEMIDLARFGELGKKGVTLMLCESTNSERPGFTPSEKSVGGTLEDIFTANEGKRIIISTFSSNVHRVQQIIDVSLRHGRRIALSGRSMQNVVSAAIELGYMNPPAGAIIDISEAKGYAPGDITVISTGSQGEPMSALYRMAFGDHRDITLGANDVVIFSSSAIPGNEKLIGRIINELCHNGIKVIEGSLQLGLHASGHASSEEIKLLYQLVKPKFYMPIHGEFRHLAANRNIATFLGTPPENIFVGDLGQVLSVSRHRAAFTDTVSAGRTLVDGFGVGDVGGAVLRDRLHLAEDGILIVFASVDLTARFIVNPPEIITKGFVYVPDSEDLLYEAKMRAAEIISDMLDRSKKPNLEAMKERVRRELSRMLSSETGRNPMIVPFITDL